MSKSGKVRFQSIRCLILCVLLAMGLALAGCGAGEASSGDAPDAEEQAEQDVNAGQVMLPSAAEVIAEAGIEASEEDQFAGDEAEKSGESEESGEPEGGLLTMEEDPLGGQGVSALPNNGLGGVGMDPVLEDLLSATNLAEKPTLKRRVLPEIYDPNQTYDIYTLVEYSIDDIGYEFTATVSAEYDFSEYEVHCTVGRTEQLVILNMYYNVIYDRTGSMGDDAQAIVQMAVEQNDWKDIGE